MPESPANRVAKRPLGGRFWAFWSAAFASNLSDGVAMIAIPWLASSLSSDPLLVAAVATAGRLPWLFLALPAGALIDRLPRFTLMITANTLRLFLWTALGLLVLTGSASLTVLVLFAFCFGTLEIIYDTSAETTVTALVPAERLERANGQLRTGALIAQEFGGRPLGGFVLTLGLAAPFLFNIASMVLSVAALLRVRSRVPADPSASEGNGERRGVRGMGADIAEGVRAVWRQPLLRLVAGIALFVNGCYATLLSTQVLFVRDTLGLGSLGFGLLMAFAAVGGVLGSQATSWLRSALPHGSLPVVCLTGSGLVYCIVALFPMTPVVAAGYFLASGLIIGYAISMVSIRQRITPDHLLGRVNSAMRLVSGGISALGLALGGVLVSGLTPALGHVDALRVPYVLTGIVSLLVMAFFGRTLARLVRRYDL